MVNPEFTPATVRARMVEAGDTLYRLHIRGLRPAGFQSSMPAVVRNWVECYGAEPAPLKPAHPLPAEIARMDEALSWFVLVKAVGYRKALWGMVLRQSLRETSRATGCSHVAVRAWQREAIKRISWALRRRQA